MPTVIDTLVLELGLDPTKFNQGQREALDSLRKMQQQLEAGGKEADATVAKQSRLFSNLKAQALSLGAAFLGGRGAKEFVQYITTLDASVGRLAVTTKMSTQELSAWQGVAVQTGGSIEGMNGTLQSLNDQVNKFLLTGEGSFLPLFNALGISLYDGNKNLKTAGALLLDVNKAVQGMDPARARSLMQGIGIDPATINTLLMGNDQLKAMLENQKNLSQITKEDADAALKLAGAWHEAEAAATQMGRAITTWLSPALTGVLNRFRNMFAVAGKGHIVDPDSLIGRMLGLKQIPLKDLPAGYKPPMLGYRDPESSGAAASSPGTSFPSAADREAYIREAARKRGIDPDTAVAVAKSEGLGGRYVGDRGSSFGDFQLHYGGIAGGGMAVGGLGDAFTKKTGLDAKDPTTWRSQVDFSLDEAKRSGWGAWHGWTGIPRAGLDGVPGGVGGDAAGGGRGNVTHTTTIGKIEVHTAATDGEGIARDIGSAMDRLNFSGSANYGQK